MDPSPQLAPPLRDLLLVASEISRTHGVRPETVLIQTLAHGSAMAGHLITFKPDGRRVTPARFSLITGSPDTRRPSWIGNELHHLHNHQDRILMAGGPRPMPSTARRRKKISRILDGGNGSCTEAVDRMNAFFERREAFRFVHPVGRGSSASAARSALPLSLELDGLPAFRKVLNSRGNLAGYASLLEAGPAERAHVLGWISNSDWPELASLAGQEDLSKLGWILTCRASICCEQLHVPSREAMTIFLRRLEIARLETQRFKFQPPLEAKTMLDQWADELAALLATLPGSQRHLALPDPNLGWHLSAILALLCCVGKEETGELDLSIIQATRVALILASWLVRSHLHHFRHSFPADHHGPFTGHDLSVLRFLTYQPAPVRSFQRRLRGVSAPTCLVALHRAVAAGLAIEADPGRFIALPRSFPKPGLSEFLSEFDPARVSAIPQGPVLTDVTDETISPAAHLQPL